MMTTQTVTKTIRLSPEEGMALEQLSREEHLPEGTLLKKLVLDGLARRRLDWACTAYARGEIDIRSAARYAGLSIYEMLDELKRRDVEIVSPDQFLDGLADLADLFDLPELREVAGELRNSAGS
jgi:predicted HTH domain antitoxin